MRLEPNRQLRIEPAAIAIPGPSAQIAKVPAMFDKLDRQMAGFVRVKQRLRSDKWIIKGVNDQARNLDFRQRLHQTALPVILVGRSKSVTRGRVSIVKVVD